MDEVRKKVKEPVQSNMRTGEVDMSMWDQFVYKPEEGEDNLKVPAELIPDGMDYQWITVSVYGKPEPHRQMRFAQGGWKEVPAMRHDGRWMPKGHQGCIEVGGLVLHERPIWISEKARERERELAKGRVKAKENQLVRGGVGVPGATHPSALGTNKMRGGEYEPIAVPTGQDYERE